MEMYSGSFCLYKVKMHINPRAERFRPVKSHALCTGLIQLAPTTVPVTHAPVKAVSWPFSRSISYVSGAAAWPLPYLRPRRACVWRGDGHAGLPPAWGRPRGEAAGPPGSSASRQAFPGWDRVWVAVVRPGRPSFVRWIRKIL